MGRLVEIKKEGSAHIPDRLVSIKTIKDSSNPEKEKTIQDSVVPNNTAREEYCWKHMSFGQLLKDRGRQALTTLIGFPGSVLLAGGLTAAISCAVPVVGCIGLLVGTIKGAISGATGKCYYDTIDLDTPIGMLIHKKIFEKTHSKIAAAICGAPAGFICDGLITAFAAPGIILEDILSGGIYRR